MTRDDPGRRAAAAGDSAVRRSHVSRLERGQFSLPRLGRLRRLAGAVEVGAGALRRGWTPDLRNDGAAEAGLPRTDQPVAAPRAPAGPAPADAAAVLDPQRFRTMVGRLRRLRRQTWTVYRRAAATVERSRVAREVERAGDGVTAGGDGAEPV